MKAKIYELAELYHKETEAFDRTVCTGPIWNNSIIPATKRERALVNQNAKTVSEKIMREAMEHGISREDMTRAIATSI